MAVLVLMVVASTSIVAGQDVESVLLDCGDAPDSYGTLIASGGPFHLLGAPPTRGVPPSGPFLGAAIDDELDGQPSPDASLDDLIGPVDDEDGVVFLTSIDPGVPALLGVTAAAPCLLDAWYDFGADGSFFELGDQIFMSEPLAPGLNVLPFMVPVTAVPGPSFARFRCSSAGGLPPFGPAGDGEVEDYATVTVPVELMSLSID